MNAVTTSLMYLSQKYVWCLCYPDVNKYTQKNIYENILTNCKTQWMRWSHLDHATNCKSSEKVYSIKWYIVVELLTKTTKIVANKYLARPVDCSNPLEVSNQLYQHCNTHALFWLELMKHVFKMIYFKLNL